MLLVQGCSLELTVFNNAEKYPRQQRIPVPLYLKQISSGTLQRSQSRTELIYVSAEYRVTQSNSSCLNPSNNDQSESNGKLILSKPDSLKRPSMFDFLELPNCNLCTSVGVSYATLGWYNLYAYSRERASQQTNTMLPHACSTRLYGKYMHSYFMIE